VAVPRRPASYPTDQLVFDAPLDEVRAGRLVEALALAPGGHVVELGCGWAELLLRVVGAHPGTTGTGVDLDRDALNRGQREVARRGLHERVELIDADATAFEDRADVVICVGAAEGIGRTARALRRIAEILEPGGLALFGDRIWSATPGAAARAELGDLPVLDGLLAVARAAGFEIVDYELSSPEEWVAFETRWQTGLEAIADPAQRERALQRTHASSHRGVVGFAWLVLTAQTG
jgi:cyclopropane fatty-acyl-phospholipid synthase-like methyltransferase